MNNSKKTNKIILLLLLFLVIFISKSSGVLINGLEDANYLCFEKIVTKFNLIVRYPIGLDGKYNFCIGNSQCSEGVITILDIDGQGETLTAGKIVEICDIKCFSSANKITLRRLPINPAIFYNKFFSTTIVNYIEVSGPNFGITQVIPAYKEFQLISEEILNNTRINLSYINSIESFSVGVECIYVDRDTPTTLINDKLSFLKLSGLMNLPDLQGYTNFKSVDFTLNPKYDVSTLSNFDNYETSSPGYILIAWPLNTEPIPFFISNNKKVYRAIFVNPNFIKPISVIDMSQSTNYQYLIIQLLSVGDMFNIDGTFPLKVNPSTQLFISNGEFTVIPELDQFRSFSLTNSKLSSELPKFSGNASMIDFSQNKIIGTLDSSYCSTELFLTGNDLTGTIPSCFTCYMTGNSVDTMDFRFSGNRFTNSGSGLDCPTLAPLVTKVDNDSIIISGTDIGFNLNNFVINNALTCSSTNSKVIQTGKSYLCFVPSEFQERIVNVTWNTFVPKRSFTFPLIVSSPIIKSIISTGGGNSIDGIGNLITIAGSFFSSYNGHKNQFIKVGGGTVENNNGSEIDCETKSTNFFGITCETKEKLLNQILYLVVSTDALSNKVYFNATDSFINDKECNVCSNGGSCDLSSGICICESGKWLGSDCTIPHHFITSITPSTVNGGNVIVYGLFGNKHDGLTISIGGINCPVIQSSISSNEIHCTAVAGTGATDLTLVQNGGSAKSYYQYIEINQACPFDCSKHGTCNSNNGECTCNFGYTGYDCSVKVDVKPPTNTTIDPSTGGTNITIQEINFSVYFKTLSEIDVNGKVVETYNLQNNWILNSTATQFQHVFKQTIKTDNICSIISTIEEIKEDSGKQFEFSGTSFKLDKNSIKFSILISNYTFKNNLNTLQLDLISMVDQNGGNGDGNCNSKETEINSNDLTTFNYIKISKNNKVLSGRFINKMLSDNKSTYLNTVVTKDKDSIIVSLKLPHCNECLVDPDFSVLVSNDFKSCDNGSSSRKWVIPVAVVVPVIISAALVVIFYFIFKNNTTVKVKLLKLKKLNK